MLLQINSQKETWADGNKMATLNLDVIGKAYY